MFKRVKTGPLPFNVEYTLQVLRCKTRALTSDEREMAEAAKSIDEKYPRPTPEEVKATLEKITANDDGDDATTVEGAAEREAVKDLG